MTLVSASCSRETAVPDGGHGYLTAAVEQDDSFTLITTKADVTAETPFALKIYKGSEMVKEISDHRTLQAEPLQLNCATYKVTAENRAQVDAVFDDPRYYGESDVKVLADQVTNADIKCSLADVLVAPAFSDDFGTYFTSWSLKVVSGNGNLVWSKELDTFGKTGYFAPAGSFTWTLSLTNNAGRTFARSETVADVKAKHKYALNFRIKTVDPSAGAAGIRIVLDDNMTEKEFDLTLDFTSSEAEAKSVNAWALFADVTGSLKSNSVPEGLKLQYKKMTEEAWTDFAGEIKTDAENKAFTARLAGLEPGANYIVRAVTAKEEGKKQIAFTTEAAAEVHNMNFDSWYMSGKAPMPNASGYSVWDSANKATAGLGTIPTKQETGHLAATGEGKSAVKLESMTAFGIMAAGNIYTGAFQKVIGMSGAALEWGTPFTSRPLALKGYFDYTPMNIDMADAAHEALKGQPDTCQIQIFLTDRADRFQINTSEGKFVDVNGSDIIAYGKVESGTVTSTKDGLVNGYEPFTIKLEYRSTTRKPTQIVIVGAASKYGDYFTGGDGSLLTVDEFELDYDY